MQIFSSISQVTDVGDFPSHESSSVSHSTLRGLTINTQRLIAHTIPFDMALVRACHSFSIHFSGCRECSTALSKYFDWS